MMHARRAQVDYALVSATDTIVQWRQTTASDNVVCDGALHAGAREVGLDVERVRAELSDGTHRTRVREDFTSGVKSGVNGTPTFYINGVRHDGDYDIDTLLAAIEQARLAGAR